jgi:hypothetical protein
MARKKAKTKLKPKPKSRLFEELVARIETTLASDDVKVTSPDHILDKITGELREVDASIRCQVGSTPILIIVECRERSRKPDTRWIEEIGNKQKDIGADKTIAVSWNGLTKPAMRKAAFYGIETRLVQEITGEEIANWKNTLQIETERIVADNVSVLVYFKTKTPIPGLELADEIKNAVQHSCFDAPLVFRKLDHSSLTVKWFVEDDEKKNGPLISRFVGESGELKISYPFAENEVYSQSSQGTMDVSGVELTVQIRRKRERFSMQTAYKYSTGGNLVAKVAECVIPFGEGNSLIITSRRHNEEAEKNRLVVSYQPQQEQKQ